MTAPVELGKAPGRVCRRGRANSRARFIVGSEEEGAGGASWYERTRLFRAIPDAAARRAVCPGLGLSDEF